MRRARETNGLEGVRSEGGLLPGELLGRIALGDKSVPGLRVDDYHVPAGETLAEAITRAWNRLRGAWISLRDERARAVVDDALTTPTRNRWLLPLFAELGYGRLAKASHEAFELDGRSYSISHLYHRSPIHLLGWNVSLEDKIAGVAGAEGASPHGLVQDFLNKSKEHLWALVSNGRLLRILRDNHSLTRQAYVEFDLESIFDGEMFHAFRVLWLVCHQSRVEAETPEECWLEKWVLLAREEGIRALDHLRDGVENAIEALGRGFLAHSENEQLRAALESGVLNTQDYYRQLLRLVYRLIFLFVAEDRDLLLDPTAGEGARKRYLRFYSTRRLRELARTRRGTVHSDQWDQLRTVMQCLDDGYPQLGLPGLGSFLWSRTSIPDVHRAVIANGDLLEAVRHLSTTMDSRGHEYPVSWRNVGAEELGSVYESLLELHPTLHGEDGFRLSSAAGHERKTTGSYYTHTSLVECLLDTALDPVMDDVVKGKRRDEAERALLDLKVCDPACGSGHFLIAAGRRIARRLAQLRVGEEEPSPQAHQHALRDVVGRCLFGVDINPMAVELCKVGLWLEAVEPGKPLSFLDAHIQAGNALLGATPGLLARGIPDIAFEALEGDDRAVASSLKRQNKAERTGQTTMTLLGPPPSTYVRLGDGARDVDDAADASLPSVRAKASKWEELVASAAYKNARFLADLWCAAFVWPKQAGVLRDLAPTEATFRKYLSNPSGASPELRSEVERIRDEYKLFHWHLAFPHVIRASITGNGLGWEGGFDVVLGNPPWDELSPDQREFFGKYRPDMRSLSREEQEHAIAQLVADESIARAWAHRLRELYATLHFLKNSGRFTMYAAGNLGKGDFNVYRMFVEFALRGVRPGGYAAQLAPAALYGGANASAIRKSMFDEHEFRFLLGCENAGKSFFPEVHPQTWFALYAVRAVGRTDRFRIAFGCDHPNKVKETVDAAIEQRADVIRKASPDTYAIPNTRNASDLALSAKMEQRHPPFGEGWPMRHYQAELHMTNDSGLFCADPEALPVYEGRMIDHFDHRAKNYVSGHGNSAVWESRPFGDPRKAVVPQWRVRRRDVPSKLGDRFEHYRLGFGSIANPRNERSFVAALIPPGTICGNAVTTIDFGWGNEWLYVPWLAVANSFVMDALTRRKLSSPNLKPYILDSLPFPRPTLGDAWVQRAAPLVLRLTCTTPEMTAFWNAMAEHGLCDSAPEGVVPPTALTDEDSRAVARAEIDAVVARDVFALSHDELSEVLETFPVVKKRDVKAYGEYRTKRVVLECFNELGAITKTGTLLQARLSTPLVNSSTADAASGSRVDIAIVPDGGWARPRTAPRLETIAAIAALLKVIGRALPSREVRLAASLVLEPRWLTASLGADASQWRRVIGSDAEPLPDGVLPFVPARDASWGAAIRQLRGTGRLVEHAVNRTWAPGSGLDAIETDGWPDERARYVLDAIQRLGLEKILGTLPEELRRSIDDVAA